MLPPELYIKGIFQVHRWIRFNENSVNSPIGEFKLHALPYVNDTFLNILTGRFQIHRLIYVKNENSKYTDGLI